MVFESQRVAAKKGVPMIPLITLGKRGDTRTASNSMLAALARRAFAYFREQRHPTTGLVLDRAGNFEGEVIGNSMASIAATGYCLSFLPEAVRQKWMNEQEAQQDAVQILRSVEEKLEHRHGILCHFIDYETGECWRNSEFSVLDTAIFLNGAIIVAEAFPKKVDIVQRVNRLLARVNWSQFFVTREGKRLLSMGWREDEGLLGPIDVRTSEAAMPLLLAIGSGKAPVEVWYNTAAKKANYREVAGFRCLHGNLPLFVHYYGLGWADLSGLMDKNGVDLYNNATNASLANRAFCRKIATRQHQTYDERFGGWWGISAGDSVSGYVASGPVFGDTDGTVWPMTAIAAVPWIPRHIARDVTRWRATEQWPGILGKYGISPFNLDLGWLGRDVIGIDLGAFLLNWANYKHRTIWNLYMRHSVVQSAIRRIGFARK